MTEKQTPSPEEYQRPQNFLDWSGGLDPYLVALSDVLPAKVFELADLS